MVGAGAIGKFLVVLWVVKLWDCVFLYGGNFFGLSFEIGKSYEG